jgi:hypothetical protein
MLFMRYFNLTHCASIFRKDEEREILLTAYEAILKLIPKLKMLLPIEDDADPHYFYKVVNAVRNAHTPRDTLTYTVLYRYKSAVVWLDLKPLGESRSTLSGIWQRVDALS